MPDELRRQGGSREAMGGHAGLRSGRTDRVAASCPRSPANLEQVQWLNPAQKELLEEQN
jgi:hypothetical protein